MRLDRLTELPPVLSRIGPREIRKAFAAPSLVSIEGERPETVFVSTLLHGNETTSFFVLQHLQQRFAHTRPPRSLLIFVGNVEAAAEGVRRLDGQPDFNRIWDHGTDGAHALAAEVVGEARKRALFASIDVHNNTGRNPVYGCVNALRPADLHLARLFAPRGVFYLNPPTTQSIAFSRLCPAVTVECGRSGDAEGLAAAIALIEAVLALPAFPADPPPAGALTLFETVGRVVVDPAARFGFGEEETAVDLSLRADLEDKNFVRMAAGEVFAERAGGLQPLQVLDEHGRDLTAEFLARKAGALRLTTDVWPAMVTADRTIIRQDCLCYLMQPIDVTGARAPAR